MKNQSNSSQIYSGLLGLIIGLVIMYFGINLINSSSTSISNKKFVPFGLTNLSPNENGDFSLPKKTFLDLLSIPKDVQSDIVLPNGEFIPNEIPLVGKNCLESCGNGAIPTIICKEAESSSLPIICECNCIKASAKLNFNSKNTLSFIHECGSEFPLFNPLGIKNRCKDCEDCNGSKTKCNYKIIKKPIEINGKQGHLLMGKCECSAK